MGHGLTPDATFSSPVPVTTPPTSPKKFDLRRLYTAAVLIPLVYVIIVLLPAWALTLLLIGVGSIALQELYRMSFQSRRNRPLFVVGLVAFALVLAHTHVSLTLAEVLLASAISLVIAMFFIPGSREQRWADTLTTFLGLLYVGVTLSTVVSVRSLPTGEWLVLFLAVVTWASDSGAYYTGTLWGKHLLIPSISPKKTVEGVFGGLLLAIAAALVAQIWFTSQLSLLDALLLGILITISGLFGDLFESMLKRRQGVKDSGGILPGHGGMLDRLDSLLFTAPTFYYYVTWVRGLSPPL